MPQILCIGGTGHVGGAVLDKILGKHADGVQVQALVRTEEKASRLVSKHPKVQIITGDLGDYDKVEAASRNADIVINTAPDITHDNGIKAILRGLKTRAEGAHPRPYYIHTSGAALIWDQPEGRKDARWWDDIADIQELSALGEEHTHAVTDRIVRDAASDVNVAIISPGFVDGMSPSTEHPTPITTPTIITAARAFKTGFQVAGGENTHAFIHVLDLARMFMILVDDALATLAGNPIERPGAAGFPTWGREAYYFGTGEDVSFAEFMQGLAPVLHRHGIFENSTEIKSVSVEEISSSLAVPGGVYDPNAPPPPPDSWAMQIAIMFGINMKIRASRMKRLGWKPEMGSVVDTFPEVVSQYLRLEKENGQ